jgi:hypothetical protein
MITPTIKSTVQKTLIFSAIFSVIIYFGSNVINASTTPSENNIPETNAMRYQEIDVPVLSNV